MNKIVTSLSEAVSGVPSGAVVLVGGFGNAGLPNNLVQALIELGVSDLTVVGNSARQWAPFLEAGRLRKIIAGFTRDAIQPELDDVLEPLIQAGKLLVETVPHGILEERIRAGGFGIPAFYSPVGIGTVLEEGKEKRRLDGRDYLLETALKGDFALIKGWKADRWGNIVTRLGAGNRNITMAMGARVTIAEVEEIVELGELDPNRVDIPGIFVDRVVQAPRVVTWFMLKPK